MPLEPVLTMHKQLVVNDSAVNAILMTPSSCTRSELKCLICAQGELYLRRAIMPLEAVLTTYK